MKGSRMMNWYTQAGCVLTNPFGEMRKGFRVNEGDKDIKDLLAATIMMTIILEFIHLHL